MFLTINGALLTREPFSPVEENVKYHTKTKEWVVPETGQELIRILCGVQPTGKEKKPGKEDDRFELGHLLKLG